MQVSRICSDLVKIKTENPPSRTTECIEYIRTFLDGLGIPCQIIGTADGQDNLVTRQPAGNLMFCGHVDVVPAMDSGWKKPPFSGIIDDEFVHGRGSTDMKGGCAAILSAAETFVNTGAKLPANLVFVCDEETGSENGIQRLLREHALPGPCDCIIAEPTPARHPNIGQKGLMRINLAFTGRPAHGSLYPAVGTSAIMEAMQFLSSIRTVYEEEHPVDPHLEEIIRQSSGVLAQELSLPMAQSVLKRVTFNPGTISGGEKSNVVAQHCNLEMEFRIPWGVKITDLQARVRAHAGTGTILGHESHEPTLTPSDCTIVNRTCDAIRQTYSGEVFPIVQWAASDARHLRKFGYDVIEYGPGELTLLHAIDERVRIESLEKAAEIYGRILHQYAGTTV
ncbi:MAG: M20 family metallopeptidase [Methanomicrobiales archaeon]|nr:M20 family metallopeptidase [Methanomicrobiales archaeon]